MARSCQWRRQVSDAVSWRQDQSLATTIYILRQTGPTGFLLKEEGEQKNFKVLLGDPHRCTCPVYMKENDLCKHICWILLKKFKVPRQNPVTWQLGLVEREINEILRGAAATQQNGGRPGGASRRSAAAAAASATGGRDGEKAGVVEQKTISEDDVCPICQDELLAKHEPVTYCKFGCGNNVHIKCMKIWAEHQSKSGKPHIECPFCREDFGSLSLLKQEMKNASERETRAERLNEHLGTTCKRCHVCPIVGKCYRCSVCVDYHLCQPCFNTATHREHSFNFRQKSSQRWRPVAIRSEGAMLPEAVVSNLMAREISDEDYDMLLQLDSGCDGSVSDLTEETLRLFPTERVRASGPLLAPGQQCHVCLRSYEPGQYVRRLPCRHKFHKTCIDEWLLHRRPTCPIDGTTYTNEGVQAMNQANRARERQRRQNQSQGEANGTVTGGRMTRNQSNQQSMSVHGSGVSMEIPGIGIAGYSSSAGSNRGQGERSSCHNSRVPSGGWGQGLSQNGDDVLNGDLMTVGSNLRIHQNGNHNNLEAQTLEDLIISMVANGNMSHAECSQGNQVSYLGLAREHHNNLDTISPMELCGHNRHDSSADRRSSAQSNSSTISDIPIIDTNTSPNIHTLTLNPQRDSFLHSRPSPTAVDRPQDRLQRNLRRMSELSRQQGMTRTVQDQEVMAVDINISGQGVTENNETRLPVSFEPNITSSNRAPESSPSVLQPISQPPSIPLPRNDNSILLDINGPRSASSVTSKPPIGDGSHGNNRRPGRLRSKPLYRETRRRSGSRERSRSLDREPQDTGSLYVGLNPSSMPAFNCDFLMSSKPSRSSKPKRGNQSENRSVARIDQSEDRDGIGDMSLSGMRIEES